MSSHYRRLLRSIHFAFNQDVKAIKMAKIQLRSEFMKNRTVQDETVLKQLINDVEDIDTMLRFHIVQGKKNQKGAFEVSLKEEHHVTIEAGQDEKFGPELTPIDPSFLGKDVTINKSPKPADGCKRTPPEFVV